MLEKLPDQIAVWTDEGRDDAAASVEVRAGVEGTVQIWVDAAPAKHLTFAALRWNIPLPEGARILGDHWERGYGDLEWRGIVPERTLPWYALISGERGELAWAVGAETGAAAFCSWRVDESGISLVLDIRCGGQGVQLSGRHFHAATLREMTAAPGEVPFALAKRFCRALCPNPRLPAYPVYGGNDWYFRYGANSAETVRRDSGLIRELSPSTENAPTFVVDAGWSPAICEGGPYTQGTAHFPDLPGLAADLASGGIRPGIWMRPLLTTETVPAHWCLPAAHPNAARPGAYLDPSVPDVLAHVRADIARLREWGFGLIKHDFSTYDILGRWGFEMGPEITAGGWAFADRSRTTAEIIRSFYAAIREAAGDTLLIGCNTVGHLGAGLFEIQRTGDDTSGRHWERTRKMGINALAFRMMQHGTFFAADADCVGLTREISWEQNRLWLDLLARSGTPLFVSASPDAVGADQREALRQAFARAACPSAPAEPLDWQKTACPRVWRVGDEVREYDWATFPETAFPCPA